jgi:mono/diheme cytochrome c family protein
MRHFLVNLATYLIAAMIVLGAGLFAWVRSSQLVISDETRTVAYHAPTGTRGFDWQELGSGSYLRNCAACHGRSGGGWDQYPGVGHAARLLAGPGGREYLIDLHLYGLASPRWRAPMPPMGHIPDVELAAVLNHVLTGYGNEHELPAGAPLFLPDEVAARRGQSLRPEEVDRKRPDRVRPGPPEDGVRVPAL